MGKPMNAGLAAAKAVECAELAGMGVTSNPDALEGQNGFGPTHHAELNTEAALADLGQVYILEGISHKYHACCHGLHAALEALREVVFASAINPEQIEHVRIKTHPRWLTVCNIAAPQTGLETKFSYRHTAALLVCGHDTGKLETYTDDLAQDDSVQAIRKRVTVEGTTSVGEMASEICITLTDGTMLQGKYDLAQPADPEDMRLRLTRKARVLVSKDTADTAWQATRPETGSVTRISEIMRSFQP
jgi:2-methylcitrate dehydratase PrpD